jgi:transposase
MHVRWQAYRSQARALIVPGAMPVVERLKAVPVESIRVDGKPRQKHIAFVGSIASGDAIGGTAGKRFWRDVISKLKRLGHRVAPEEYECIVAAVAAKVGGRPTEAELKQFEREREWLMQSLQTSLAPCARSSARQRLTLGALTPKRRPALRPQGDATPKPIGGDHRSHRTEAHAAAIFSALEAAPDLTLEELREKLAQERVLVSYGALWRFLDRNKITRKKRPRTPASRIDQTS